MNLSDAVANRFWPKVDKAGDCWLWTGVRNPKGYGRFHLGGRLLMAHRIAYELTVGPIPEGMQLDHLCRTRACVRPDHLEPVTQRVNILRGVAPSAQNAQRAECVNGHAFTPANTYTTPNGRRQCRVCIRARGERSAARRRPQAG